MDKKYGYVINDAQFNIKHCVKHVNPDENRP